MGAETEKFLDISFVTDTDVSYYEIGEVDGHFQKDQLQRYLKAFGKTKLLEHLAFLQYQVIEAMIVIHQEAPDEEVKSCVKEAVLFSDEEIKELEVFSQHLMGQDEDPKENPDNIKNYPDNIAPSA